MVEIVALCGGVLVVAFGWWSKITIAKEKRLTEASQPVKSHIVPLYNGVGLTTHELTDISHLYGVVRISITVTISIKVDNNSSQGLFSNKTLTQNVIYREVL